MSATNGNGQGKPGQGGSGARPAPQPPPFSRRQIVENAYTAREQWLRRVTGASDPRRNIDHECGYPEGPVDAQTFQDLYDRDMVANRVVQVFPKETWQTQPQVYELEDSEEATPFEAAWDGLSRQLKGGNSYHQDEEGSVVWEHIRRADILSGIGYFGVILLGIDDGLPLSEPVRGMKEQNSYPADVGKPSTAPSLTPSLNEVRPYRLTTNADPAPVASRKLLTVIHLPPVLNLLLSLLDYLLLRLALLVKERLGTVLRDLLARCPVVVLVGLRLGDGFLDLGLRALLFGFVLADVGRDECATAILDDYIYLLVFRRGKIPQRSFKIINGA